MIEGMKTNRKNVGLRLLLPLCLLPSGALAQQSPPAPALASLAQALGAMPASSVGDGAVALTVGAQGIRPAPLPPPPEADAGLPENPIPTPQSLAAQYGRLGGWFGHVYVLAPPTMTVLSSNPALADLPLSVLASQHPTPFLIGSLTPEQLRQMAGEGLAFGDLMPDQQGLLKAMLPRPFQTVPTAIQPPKGLDFQKPGADMQALIKRQQALNQDYQQHWRTTPEDSLYQQVRLHGFLTSEFTFDTPGGASIGVRASDDGFTTTGADKLVNGGNSDIALVSGGGQTQIQGYLRAETANMLKDGDLRWTRPDLDRPVSLQQMKTVDELVARAAAATHLELYADPHYGAQPVLLVGDLKKPQPAGDLMQALAVCVSGAWRQVGPAYVLTDDVQGLGARQKFLREMVQTWSNRLSKAGEEVGGHLQALDWTHALRFPDGDAGALTPGQVDALGKGKNYGTLPWKSLPAPLQAALRGQLTRHFEGDNMASFERAGKSVAQGLKPDAPAGVNLNLQLAVSLPGTGAMALGGAYRVQVPRDGSGPAGPPASANSVSVDKPLRGVLCAPRTPDEARAVVARLPKMGLNALFLDVFTNGRTYFPNAALPPETDQSGAVLQAALDAAKPLHMPVYAVVDTLCWRKDGASAHPKPWPAGCSEDLTISGEAPDQSIQRQMEAHSIRADFEQDYEMQEKGNQGWASPLDPAVRALLPRLVRALAASRGIAGVVFQDTLPPGYLGSTQEYDDEGIALGYAPANRLAYLRTHRMDPVDLSPGYDSLSLWLPTDGFQAQFDVSIPGFQSVLGGSRDEWAALRGEADKSLLADCFAAARRAAPALPLFMRERRIGVTLDPWTDPRKLNEYASTDSLSYPLRQINAASILCIPYGPVERKHPQWFVLSATDSGPAGDNGKRAGGEIFDLVKGYSPDSLADTLDRLDVFLKKPANP